MIQSNWFCKDMLADLFCRIWESRCLTVGDRQSLSRVVLNPALDSEDLAAIDRITHAVRRGWLTCIN